MLTVTEVVSIKRSLWNGRNQTDVASDYGVTQTTISRIRQGISYPHIAWPDGSIGAMPNDQIRINHLRRRKHRTPKMTDLLKLLESNVAKRKGRNRPVIEATPHLPHLSDFDEARQQEEIDEIVHRLQSTDHDLMGTEELWNEFLVAQDLPPSVEVEAGSGEDPDALDLSDPLDRWEEILEALPHNRMVEAAKITDDPILKRAVVLAIEQVGKALRDSDQFPDFVAQVAESIRPLYSMKHSQED